MSVRAAITLSAFGVSSGARGESSVTTGALAEGRLRASVGRRTVVQREMKREDESHSGPPILSAGAGGAGNDL
jgi:hypothetical protein